MIRMASPTKKGWPLFPICSGWGVGIAKKMSKRSVVILMAVLILVPGAIGFGDKLYQFVVVLTKNPQGRFALVPLASYLLVSTGFIFIFVWGLMKGMLSDVEGPKYRMLEREKQLDKEEAYDAA